MSRIPFLFLLFLAISSYSQLPETDIFICEFKISQGKTEFSKPENITNRHGYDNHPYFMPDGKRLLYVAVPDTTQSDI